MRKEKRKIVLYFGKEKDPSDPFGNFGSKRKVYYELFDCGIESGFDMYVSSGREFYFGGLTFGNILKYGNGRFERLEGTIEADAVYDRSGGLVFPSDEISHRVLNCAAFKRLCGDKNLTYDVLGDFMPKSIEVGTTEEVQANLEGFSPNEKLVLKPASDFGGKGIFIDYPEKLATLPIDRPYVLQEFVDTSGGIENVVEGCHDLRMIIVEGEMVLAHVRTPKEGCLLANVAQGGKIREIPLEKIPSEIISMVRDVRHIIDDKFNKPLYSIDFGVSKGRPYIFELNDQIGFPNEGMANRKLFVRNIIKSLGRLANQ